MYKGYICNAIVTARMTSTRLPGKVLLPLGKENKPALQHIIERLRQSKYIDSVIIATTTNVTDNPIIDLCNKLDCDYYRGNEDDVLTRVLDTAKAFGTDIIVDVTGDCPCTDYILANKVIEFLVDKKTCNGDKLDHCSNVINREYPRGLDVQAYWTKVLERANTEIDNKVDRQHVSTWIYKNPKNLAKYKVASISNGSNLSHIRLTLDTKEDYMLLKFLFEATDGLDFPFNLSDLECIFVDRYPELLEINKHIEQKNYYKELIEAYGKYT